MKVDKFTLIFVAGVVLLFFGGFEIVQKIDWNLTSGSMVVISIPRDLGIVLVIIGFIEKVRELEVKQTKKEK